MKVLAKMYFLGTMEGYGHTSPVTGKSYVFPSSTVPAKITDERDVEFYSKHQSFRVEPVEGKTKEAAKEAVPEEQTKPEALKPAEAKPAKAKEAPIKKKE